MRTILGKQNGQRSSTGRARNSKFVDRSSNIIWLSKILGLLTYSWFLPYVKCVKYFFNICRGQIFRKYSDCTILSKNLTECVKIKKSLFKKIAGHF